MSGAIATAYVKLIPTFDKQLSSSIKKQLEGVDSKSSGSKVGKLFSRGVDSGMSGLKNAMSSRFSAATVALGNIAAKAVTTAFSAVASSMDSAIKRVDTINNFPRIMEGMGISAEASAASIRRLSDGIDGLPTALDDAVSGVQRFTAKNGDIERSTEYFLAVNNAIASGGQSMEIQSSALEQLSQSYSKGRMDMMEWRSLQQAMPAQLNQIAKAMGKTTDELGEGLRSGEVSMDEFMDKITELNREGVDGLDSFEQQARKATGGIGTALTNVQNRVNKAVAGIIDAIGQENISSAINAFSSQFGKIGQIIGGLDDGKVVGFIGGLKSGLESAFEGWTPNFKIDWDGVFAGMRDTAQRAGEWLSGPLSAAVKVVDEGMVHLGETFQAAAARLNLPEINWDAVADGISRVIEVMGHFTFEAIGNAVFELANVGSKLGEVFAPFIEKIGPGLEQAGQNIANFTKPIADFITGHGPAFDGMMERIGEHIADMSPILESIGGHFNSLAEKMAPIAGPLGEALAEVIGHIASAFVALGTVVLTIVDGIMAVLDTLADGLEVIGRAADIAASHFVEGWEPMPPMLFDINEGVNTVGSSINNLPTEHNTDINVNTAPAESALDRVKARLDQIQDKNIQVTATGVMSGVMSVFGMATGGVTLGSIRRIPRHADGGISGIVTRPTLTNYGWVGEAGAEAIVPLSNKRYVGEFARAVASEVNGGNQIGNVTMNVYPSEGMDEMAFAQLVTSELKDLMAMGA